ncbi:MCE family protein [Goodfellowiella coeruleoviolacea]|uniref:Phospholipid/cholesterol/gamma-HCH transport system substrate-binding protein n=1 Tax=Goodfellowiella coeruleoviolacea TaxID=334858 RepID=A0AAE3KJ77_9PSEU|nr:MCE family protein [Goodfellowiella coeruleoviolacea]MCP2169310.1 phospholipid/cholesterol/gamma-HCH transport system substrate-binding protein [Goodfellowiella coeruleoviolacea]
MTRHDRRDTRARNPVRTGLVGLVLLGLLVLAATNSEDLPIIGGGTTYTAEFSEAAGLTPDNEVRVAGFKVGEVTSVRLAGDHVLVAFRVSDVWVGDQTTAAIRVKTLLGQKYLALDPVGSAPLDPDQPIPRTRTAAPYDVIEAFNGLATTVGQIDTTQLADSFTVLSQTFRDSPDSVREALAGLSTLSRTISSRDERLATLLANTRQLSTTLADHNDQFERLLADSEVVLAEVGRRREAISALLTGTQRLATELSGLVADNTARLRPALEQLDEVTEVLRRNQDDLDRSLELLGPYYRLLSNAMGNGRWLDSYLCGLVAAPPATPSSGCVPPRPQDGGR